MGVRQRHRTGSPLRSPVVCSRNMNTLVRPSMAHAGRNRSTPTGRLPLPGEMGPDYGKNCG